MHTRSAADAAGNSCSATSEKDFTPACGNCDNCDRGLSGDGTETSSLFETGQRVVHREWGDGTIGTVADGQITVVFDSVGYETLDLRLVADRHLLEAASGQPTNDTRSAGR